MRTAGDIVVAGFAIALGLWGVEQFGRPEGGSFVRSPGAAPRVRILQFRVSVGALIVGQKAQLCYGVENARSVRIAPVVANVDPAPNRCLVIGPRHTTLYTLMAVGYDGSIVTRSLTLPVQTPPPEPHAPLESVRLAPAPAAAAVAP